MSLSPAPGAAHEGSSSILEETTLDTPGFRWLGLKKLTWQVGRRPLSLLSFLRAREQQGRESQKYQKNMLRQQ